MTLGEVGVAFVQLQRAGRLRGAGRVVRVVGVERVDVLVTVLQAALLLNGPGGQFGGAERRRCDGETVSPRLHLQLLRTTNSTVGNRTAKHIRSL